MTRQCNVPHQIGEVPFCSPMTHLFPSCSNLDLFIHWRASQGVIYLYVNARCMCMCACRGMGAADEVATKQRSRFGWMQQEKEEGRQLAQLCPHMRWHMYSPSESMGVCSWPLFRSGSSLTNAMQGLEAKEKGAFEAPPCMHACMMGGDSSTKTNKQILIWCSAGHGQCKQEINKERARKVSRGDLIFSKVVHAPT